MNYSQVHLHSGGKPIQNDRQFLTNILDSMDVLVIILGSDGSLIRFNKACERLFGYTTEDIRSKLQTGVLPLPGGPLGVIKNMLRSIRSATDTQMHETEWATKDGDVRTITWSVKNLSNEYGEIEYIFATGTDITSLKIAERRLRQEQVLLRSLINSIPDPVFYKDTDGAYLGCNYAFETFSGRSSHETIVGHTDFEFYPKDVADVFAQSDQQVLRSKKVLRYENKITRSDGEDVVLETRKSPYYGPDSELLGVIGISRDITNEKIAENALRKANAEIAQLIASLSSILIVLSPDIRVVQWNPSAQKILGVSQNEAIGNRLNEIGIQWEFDPIFRNLELCRKDCQPKYLDPLRFKRSDGYNGYLGINISPIYEHDSEFSGYILLAGDITERKALENQLTQAQKLESIGQLAAGIAHEINTPIQYVNDNTGFLKQSLTDLIEVLGQYDLLLENARKGEIHIDQIESIDKITKEIDLSYLCKEIPLAIDQSLEGLQRVAEIVRAMKDFSHPGVEKKISMDVNKAIANTITVARNEWKYVADIQTDLAKDLPNIVCLPGEINQALLSIIVNAAQAIEEVTQNTPGEKGLITIKTQRISDFVEIYVCDTGSGIPKEVGPHIFEPFYTTKEVGKGTGQGLAIAYNIIKIKHSGNLTFTSQDGKGTTFVIRLPIYPPEISRDLSTKELVKERAK